jgi:hypothetical protein
MRQADLVTSASVPHVPEPSGSVSRSHPPVDRFTTMLNASPFLPQIPITVDPDLPSSTSHQPSNSFDFDGRLVSLSSHIPLELRSVPPLRSSSTRSTTRKALNHHRSYLQQAIPRGSDQSRPETPLRRSDIQLQTSAFVESQGRLQQHSLRVSNNPRYIIYQSPPS